MNHMNSRTRFLKAIVALALVFATTTALAQRSPGERRNSRSSSAQKEEVKYPNATRQEPEAKASAKMGSKLQKLIGAYNDDKYEGIPAMAEEILADEKANAYDKSLTARILGATQTETDPAAAQESFKKAIEFNGLNNNDHFEAMWVVAQLQAQEEQYQESNATLDRLLAETNARTPEHLGLKGIVLYQAERFPEAIAALDEAIKGTQTPKSDWMQLLMAAYSETGDDAKALALAEQVAANAPDDTRSQLNLAATYIQSGQDAKAIEVYERLRAAGQLTDEAGYRNLVALYLGQENKEREAIAVINEGLDKQILKPDHKTYSLLAQSYYFSDQTDQAIEAYRKAAPLAPDGEAYLNLAKALWTADRLPEAKQAAQQALDKGIKNPQEARTILSQKG